MKTVQMILLVVCCFVLLGMRSGSPVTADPAADTRVQDLLKKMTLEEKVGQMTQVTIDVVSVGSDGRQEPHALDPKKLEDAVVRHHVGSILNVGPAGYTADHWVEVIAMIQDMATKKTRLKIPVLYGIDAVHGANYTEGATLFPQAIALAATWNTDLAKREGEVTAYEVRASGIPWNFYPVLDIGRQPLWPRLWETFGEDVCLASSMGKSYIQGLQGDNYGAPDKVAACLKHYAGYSFPLSGKDRTAAWIPERMMREYFLPAFEEAVKAGAPSVMVNSAEVDGIPGHANYHLLTEILRGEMQFKGLVVSDWADIERLYSRDRVATSPKDAVRKAVMAGVDMSMVPLSYSFYDLLLECVKEGTVPMSRIDEAVGRILKVKYDMGLFDNPYPDKSMKSKIASADFAAANLQAAQECLVLLKNEKNVLPLAKQKKVLVTGPTATSLSAMNGGWTITWQGNDDARYPKNKPTILQAIEAKIGKENVTYVPGATFEKTENLDAAVAAAKNVDAAIICLGEPAYCETPGNIDDLTLNKAQLDLAAAIAKTGTPVIVVLIEGRPRIISSIADTVSAIVAGFLPGMEGGRAVADALFGDVNPSGKLPVTYPRSPNALMCYDHKPADVADGNRYNPQFPFGHGLSYTTFAYSDLKLARNVITKDENLAVSVTVKNTGAREGKEVVQLYIQDEYGSVSRPVRQLKGFTKVALQPGTQETVTFTLTPQDLSFIGLENKRVVEPGTFKVMVDTLKAGFTLQ